MSILYSQTPVQVEFSPLADPPGNPFVPATGKMPKIWRASPIALQIGVFDQFGNCVDLTNLAALRLVIQRQNHDVVSLVDKTITSDQIVAHIGRGNWLNGTAQQATFVLNAWETDFDLSAQDSQTFWITLQGYNSASNQPIVYGAGHIRVTNPGATLPFIMPGLNSLNAQTNVTGNTAVEPTSLNHTEKITFTGSPSARNVTIDPVGLASGTRIDILAIFDSFAQNGIVVNVYGALINGTPLFTFTRAGSEGSALFRFVADGIGGFVPVQAIIPAY